MSKQESNAQVVAFDVNQFGEYMPPTPAAPESQSNPELDAAEKIAEQRLADLESKGFGGVQKD